MKDRILYSIKDMTIAHGDRVLCSGISFDIREGDCIMLCVHDGIAHDGRHAAAQREGQDQSAEDGGEIAGRGLHQQLAVHAQDGAGDQRGDVPIQEAALILFATNNSIVGGSERIELAKITGITPLMLTLIGMCVL